MIGITGGIASGKSVVSERLRHLGAVILDADVFSRDAINPHTPGWYRVKEAFPSVIQSDLAVDRRLLGRVVFADAKRRKILESIIHPEVLRRLQAEAKIARQEGKIVFADVPLLYEVGWERFMDQVWVVYVREDVQLKRLMERSSISKEEARQMVASQLSLEEKIKRATAVIDNNSSLEETWRQVDALWKELESDSCIDRT